MSTLPAKASAAAPAGAAAPGAAGSPPAGHQGHLDPAAGPARGPPETPQDIQYDKDYPSEQQPAGPAARGDDDRWGNWQQPPPGQHTETSPERHARIISDPAMVASVLDSARQEYNARPIKNRGNAPGSADPSRSLWPARKTNPRGNLEEHTLKFETNTSYRNLSTFRGRPHDELSLFVYYPYYHGDSARPEGKKVKAHEWDHTFNLALAGMMMDQGIHPRDWPLIMAHKHSPRGEVYPVCIILDENGVLREDFADIRRDICTWLSPETAGIDRAGVNTWLKNRWNVLIHNGIAPSAEAVTSGRAEIQPGQATVAAGFPLWAPIIEEEHKLGLGPRYELTGDRRSLPLANIQRAEDQQRSWQQGSGSADRPQYQDRGRSRTVRGGHYWDNDWGSWAPAEPAGKGSGKGGYDENPRGAPAGAYQHRGKGSGKRTGKPEEPLPGEYY